MLIDYLWKSSCLHHRPLVDQTSSFAASSYCMEEDKLHFQLAAFDLLRQVTSHHAIASMYIFVTINIGLALLLVYTVHYKNQTDLQSRPHHIFYIIHVLHHTCAVRLPSSAQNLIQMLSHHNVPGP